MSQSWATLHNQNQRAHHFHITVFKAEEAVFAMSGSDFPNSSECCLIFPSGVNTTQIDQKPQCCWFLWMPEVSAFEKFTNGNLNRSRSTVLNSPPKGYFWSFPDICYVIIQPHHVPNAKRSLNESLWQVVLRKWFYKKVDPH